MLYVHISVSLRAQNQSATPLIHNRPPLPPQMANQHWENAVRRSDSFNSVASPTLPPLPPQIPVPPQCYPSNSINSNDNNFINQRGARRHVPMPNGNSVSSPTQPPAIPQRNMSSSVFSLNSHAGYQQPSAGFPPHNAWGMHSMGQVS